MQGMVGEQKHHSPLNSTNHSAYYSASANHWKIQIFLTLLKWPKIQLFAWRYSSFVVVVVCFETGLAIIIGSKCYYYTRDILYYFKRTVQTILCLQILVYRSICHRWICQFIQQNLYALQPLAGRNV